MIGGGRWGWLYELPRIVIFFFFVIGSIVISSVGVEGRS